MDPLIYDTHSRHRELCDEAAHERLLACCRPVDGQWLLRLARAGALLIALGRRLQRPALQAGLLPAPGQPGS